MRKALVTGAAGFIGRTLVTRLARSATTWWAQTCGAAGGTSHHPSGVHHVEVDLGRDDPGRLRDLCDGVDVVYHLAGRPGVQSSWGEGFRADLDANLAAGLRILEAALDRGVQRVVIASSSSVYGHMDRPASEDDQLRPVSPYGVTKAALEQLAGVYGERGVSTVVLRYFTVYGPNQRPDMALHRIIASGLGGPPFPLRGDGQQRRDFTFVDDAVDATIAAGAADVAPGTVLNVGSARPVTLIDAIEVVEGLLAGPVHVVHRPRPPGDPMCTAACVDRAAALLAWEPTTALSTGLSRQVHTMRRSGWAAGAAHAADGDLHERRQLSTVT